MSTRSRKRKAMAPGAEPDPQVATVAAMATTLLPLLPAHAWKVSLYAVIAVLL